MNRRRVAAPILLAGSAMLFAASPHAAQTPQPAVAFACPAIEPMPRAMAIATRYAGPSVDPTFSTLDDAKVDQQKGERRKFDRAVTRINGLANGLALTKDDAVRAAMRDCLARHFASIPASNAMEGADSAEDRYYRDWMVSSLALSYLRVREELDTAPDAEAVHGWFGRKAASIRSFYDARSRQRGLDNHAYWGATAVAAIGRLNSDKDATAYARTVLAEALAQVGEDGTLAAELKRGRKARHYHYFSLVPLTAIAILTETRLSSAEESAFQRLVERVTSDFEDPAGGLLAAKAGMPQDKEEIGALQLVMPLVATDKALAGRVETLTRGQRAFSYFLGGSLQYLIDRSRAAPAPE